MWPLESPRQSKVETSRLGQGSLPDPLAVLSWGLLGQWTGSRSVVQSGCPSLLTRPTSSGCPGLVLSESQQQGGQMGLHWAPPLPRVFHLLFQTNMKLRPQIKGESSSILPYSLTNGVGGSTIWKGRIVGYNSPPGVHKPKCTLR